MARDSAAGALGMARGLRPWWGLMAASALVVAAIGGTAAWLATEKPILPPPVEVAIVPPVVEAPGTETTLKTGVAAAPEAGPPPDSFSRGASLAAAPDSALIEKVSKAGVEGFLPVISSSGRTAWKTYAKPFDAAEKRPRIAIVIDNLGTSATETDNAINKLPAEVSLSFMPYRGRLGQWITLARDAGHEVLLDLTMEPLDTEHTDLGPNALRSALDPATNLNRLQWIMTQATGYVGMAAFLGGRFASSREDLKPILAELKKRGLLYVDNRAAPQSVAPALAAELGVPFAAANRVLDSELTRGAIDRKLGELEDVAKHNGSAVGIGQADQLVLERIIAWAPGLGQRGFVLAPLSAVAQVAPLPVQPSSGEDAKPGKSLAAAPGNP